MRALKALRFVTGFGVARGLLFASPIALSNFLSLESYGLFELAHSYASIGAVVLGFSLSATVPLIRLRDEIKGRWDTLLLLVSVLAGVYLLLAISTALILGAFYLIPVLVLTGISVLVLQGLWATSLKCDGHGTKAVFVESGFWAVAVGGAGLFAIAGGRLTESVITMALMTYAFCLLAFTGGRLKLAREGAIAISDLKQNFSLGLPLMLTSLSSAVIISSGRLVLGQISGVEIVGIYAVLFRATALSLVAHQLLIIGFFRQLYSWPEELLRARASIIVLGVSTAVVGFWVLEPSLGWLLGPRFAEVFAAFRTETLIVLVQTILWSAIVLNDLINSRLQIAGKVTKFSAPFLLAGLGTLSLWTWSSAQTMDIGELLQGFIVRHFCLMTGLYLLQCAASWWLGHRFTRLWLTTIACTVGSTLILLLW